MHDCWNSVHHKPVMMNKQRRDTKRCNQNISCTNCEVENTAVHVVRYESLAHKGQRNQECATPIFSNKHEVPATDKTNFNTRRFLAQNSHKTSIGTELACTENKLQHWTSFGTKLACTENLRPQRLTSFETKLLCKVGATSFSTGRRISSSLGAQYHNGRNRNQSYTNSSTELHAFDMPAREIDMVHT